MVTLASLKTRQIVQFAVAFRQVFDRAIDQCHTFSVN